MIYRFHDCELDIAMFELRVDGERRAIEPQVFEVLAYLIEHRDRLVPRTEILDAVWGDRFVSDSALASRVAAARSAVRDDGKQQKCIRTVHGRGLQFVAPVEIVEEPVVPGAPPGHRSDDHTTTDLGDLQQTVRFVAAPDGLQLAVATLGDGPTTLVKAANWLTHVEHDWRSPVWQHWIGELGRRFRFVRYDARGCGLSDHDLSHTDLTDVDVWTDDLEAVVESSGAERFVLLGMSQGAVPAIGYALQHPERVSHLVLYGAYARGMSRRGPEAAATAETLVQLMRTGWGGRNPAFRAVFTMTFMPDASSEQIRWFNELQANSSDAHNALLLETAFHDLDLTSMASQVTVPTLVVHGRDDHATPHDEGRRLAAAIPDAEFVTLESRNHVLTADESAWPDFLDQLDRFTSAG